MYVERMERRSDGVEDQGAEEAVGIDITLLVEHGTQRALFLRARERALGKSAFEHVSRTSTALLFTC